MEEDIFFQNDMKLWCSKYKYVFFRNRFVYKVLK